MFCYVFLSNFTSQSNAKKLASSPNLTIMSIKCQNNNNKKQTKKSPLKIQKSTFLEGSKKSRKNAYFGVFSAARSKTEF